MIKQERVRQVRVEGYTVVHDDAHASQELAEAAAMYALPERDRKIVRTFSQGVEVSIDLKKTLWPFHSSEFRPCNTTYEGRLKELAKSGALIVAEMERLMRRRARAGIAE